MNKLLKGWNLMRVLYLAMGAMLVVQGITENQIFTIVFGVILFGMGVFKMGCANTNAICNIDNSKNDNETDKIDFEEIK